MELNDLVAQRLAHAEALRERSKQSWVFVYCPKVKPASGEIAEPPDVTNTLQMREGDFEPKGWMHWEYSLWNLKQWFEDVTVKTGINVRRWKS